MLDVARRPDDAQDLPGDDLTGLELADVAQVRPLRRDPQDLLLRPAAGDGTFTSLRRADFDNAEADFGALVPPALDHALQRDLGDGVVRQAGPVRERVSRARAEVDDTP